MQARDCVEPLFRIIIHHAVFVGLSAFALVGRKSSVYSATGMCFVGSVLKIMLLLSQIYSHWGDVVGHVINVALLQQYSPIASSDGAGQSTRRTGPNSQFHSTPALPFSCSCQRRAWLHDQLSACDFVLYAGCADSEQLVGDECCWTSWLWLLSSISLSDSLLLLSLTVRLQFQLLILLL